IARGTGLGHRENVRTTEPGASPHFDNAGYRHRAPADARRDAGVHVPSPASGQEKSTTLRASLDGAANPEPAPRNRGWSGDARARSRGKAIRMGQRARNGNG